MNLFHVLSTYFAKHSTCNTTDICMLPKCNRIVQFRDVLHGLNIHLDSQTFFSLLAYKFYIRTFNWWFFLSTLSFVQLIFSSAFGILLANIWILIFAYIFFRFFLFTLSVEAKNGLFENGVFLTLTLIQFNLSDLRI